MIPTIPRYSRAALTVSLGLILILAGSWAGEASLRKTNFEEMTLDATLVVHGKVVDLHSFYGPWSHASDEVIVTEVTLQPLTVLRGEAREPVVFRVAGGTVDDLSMLASESPIIDKGQEILVFLNEHPLGFQFIFAHWQGKYDVIPTGDGRSARSPRVETELDEGTGRGEKGVSRAGKLSRRVRGLPGAPLSRSTSLERLSLRVREIVRKHREAEAKAESESESESEVENRREGGR